MKKYMVHAGPVISNYDGQGHIISCSTLMMLYRVPPSECILIPYHKQELMRGYSQERLKELIHLYPRSNGDYNINNS